MEQLLKENLLTILLSILLLISVVYILVKIHKWLFKISITILALILGMTFYYHYNGKKLINLDDIKSDLQKIFLSGKDGLYRETRKIKKETALSLGKKILTIAKDEDLDDLLNPLEKIQDFSEKYLQSKKSQGSQKVESYESNNLSNIRDKKEVAASQNLQKPERLIEF